MMLNVSFSPGNQSLWHPLELPSWTVRPWYYHLFSKTLTELSFLMLGTGVEEFLEGYQFFLPCDIGLPNNFPFHDGVSKISAEKVLILEL